MYRHVKKGIFNQYFPLFLQQSLLTNLYIKCKDIFKKGIFNIFPFVFTAIIKSIYRNI